MLALATGLGLISVLLVAVEPEGGIDMSSRIIRWSCVGVVLLLISSCAGGNDSVRESGVLGPLAVLDDAALGESASLGGTGLVRVTERCVELEVAESGARRLLAWRSAQVRWDSGAIVFTAVGGGRVTIEDGDTVTVSGEDLVGDEPVERDVRWVAEPDASCARDVFVVHGARLVEPR